MGLKAGATSAALHGFANGDWSEAWGFAGNAVLGLMANPTVPAAILNDAEKVVMEGVKGASDVGRDIGVNKATESDCSKK
jgi:hypothetical protein